MQIKSLLFAVSLTATTTALPATHSETFGIVAIHSGSDVQYSSFNAAKSSIFAGLKKQDASCARPKEQDATFYIQNGALFLYDTSATPQEIYVDRSGMGQGVIGYTTGAQGAPKYSERKGWTMKDGHLQFAGDDLIACPNSIDGAWSIWASAGVANPGGNKNCVGVAARVEKTSNPNGCLYTE
ncbi:hypothetical protein N7448_004454 [Penicillium atrosanguineum]|uniref:Cell wall protein PhiA n=1 Tax=Penicillium atrosanguineum TaxID=1132637 RepID=A0A9W9L331_9EURO|nr:uncharacterized protein N7443_008207 [Penicillium atrosanguineum]KAJ5125127.1 hypothetical protein N7526_007304 [Penicillium atrosanguineum]KAJ5135900.1 hypothetical protein N7448_004454 [Penicillium atrosanguineum]KAJ5292254.1 hypothetical protein N7443_008207 [Penicillium atrosanguineum]KAJ5303726.1 hypothetical protein N7476_010525 [Penicillium atrosanguineum]